MEDIGSSVVWFVGVREEWIDGDCIVQWASLISHTLGTSLTHLPIHSLSKPITCPSFVWFPFPYIHGPCVQPTLNIDTIYLACRQQ